MSQAAEPLPRKPPRPRRAWIAVLLSLLTPGLGHIYTGRPRRGLAMFALATGWILLAVWWRTGGLPRFWMTVPVFGLWLVMMVYILVDAARLAVRANPFEPGPANRWYVYVGVWLAGMLVTSMPLSIAGTYAPSGWFDVASSSMEPTLRLGERFLVDPAYYRGHQPMRGDVAVYVLASAPRTIYLKRIVAVAGDRIAVKNGVAVVNGQPAGEPYIHVANATSAYNNMGEVIVPAGQVFMLGDNRDNSLDSRARTHGTIAVTDLRGRVTDIGFSRDLTRLGRWVGTPR